MLSELLYRITMQCQFCQHTEWCKIWSSNSSVDGDENLLWHYTML